MNVQTANYLFRVARYAQALFSADRKTKQPARSVREYTLRAIQIVEKIGCDLDREDVIDVESPSR